MRWMPASAVSLADRPDTDAHRGPERDSAGRDTLAVLRVTGRDSPVIIDSSKSACRPRSCHLPERARRAERARYRPLTARRRARVPWRRPSHVRRHPAGARRARRARPGADGRHLLPVPEEHDRDQRRKLPPEFEVEQSGRRQDAGGKGDGNRQ